MPNPQPFHTEYGSRAIEMETALPGRSFPVKQGSHCLRGRGWLAACCSVSLIKIASLSVRLMSKAATAIHGNCIQHPLQICIFPSQCTWCHVYVNIHVRFMSHYRRQRSSPVHALNPHISPSPILPVLYQLHLLFLYSSSPLYKKHQHQYSCDLSTTI